MTECEECGGMGHTIGFLGNRKYRYKCETCNTDNNGDKDEHTIQTHDDNNKNTGDSG